MMSKEKLLRSFSGGRTSAYMSAVIGDRYADKYEMVTVFANTGCEHERTLEFVHKCDLAFGLKTVWIEATINEGRKGTGYKIVDFESASRNGEPFKSMCAKYGLPNQSYPHCTRELKLQPINAYLKDIDFVDCLRAVGIRTDEERRRAKDAEKRNVVYPLLDWLPSDKEDVDLFWEEQDFDLELPPRLGNCVWCWKKSDTKHYANILEDANNYEVPLFLDRNYSFCGNGSDIRDKGERTMFRRHRNTHKMIMDAAQFEIEELEKYPSINSVSGCTEACEAYA